MEIILSGQLLFAALVLGSLYSLIALGLNLVYGTMRLLNIAHGDLVMIGGYAAFWCFTLLGLSPIVGLPVIAAITGGLGLLLYRFLFRGQISSGKPVAQLEANSLLLFFGISVVIQNVAALTFSATPRAYQHLDTVYHLGAVAMTGNRIAALAVAGFILVAVVLYLNRSIYGLAIKALIQHREAARIVGINVERVQMASIAVGFGIAGVAGTLVSLTEQVSPFMGFPFTIASFVVIIMGGLGNIAGGIIAGFLLAFIEIYAVALTSANFRSILIYGIFVGVLLLRPQGLLGKARRS
ncbi:MAG: branched-chain amino acid ABC transporter permease [Alphaproteobacteria bacterium]